MSALRHMDLSPGMPSGIGIQPLEDLEARVMGYCTHQKSGWHTYDLLGAEARRRGHFDEIAPWSLLWAVTLAGRLSVSDVAGFTHQFRSELVERLRALPAKDLASMDDDELEALTLLCRSGFPGAWAPKLTKMLALYRPDAIPVLDGHVARAMGFERNAFSVGKKPRWERIERSLLTLRTILREQNAQLALIRDAVAHVVPDIDEASDLRLLDMVIWTSQDDRMTRPGSPANYWLKRQGHPYRPERIDPLPLH